MLRLTRSLITPSTIDRCWRKLRLSRCSTMLYMLPLPLSTNTKASHAICPQDLHSDSLESYRRSSNLNSQPHTNHHQYTHWLRGGGVSQAPNPGLLNPSMLYHFFFLLGGRALILDLRALTFARSEDSPPLRSCLTLAAQCSKRNPHPRYHSINNLLRNPKLTIARDLTNPFQKSYDSELARHTKSLPGMLQLLHPKKPSPIEHIP